PTPLQTIYPDFYIPKQRRSDQSPRFFPKLPPPTITIYQSRALPVLAVNHWSTSPPLPQFVGASRRCTAADGTDDTHQVRQTATESNEAGNPHRSHSASKNARFF
ncbi:Hypothetical predicted protein, partial [Olea europaea subsp. europaea]